MSIIYRLYSKEATVEEDLAKFSASLPGELPEASDIATLLQPATNLATKAVDGVKGLDTEMLQDDVQQV